MIRKTQTPPEVFAHQSPDHVHFELSDDKGVYGYAALRRRGVYADVHIELERWSHNVLKQVKADADLVKRMCRDMGVEMLIAQKNLGDTRWPKFIKHLGFGEPEQIQISRLEI